MINGEIIDDVTERRWAEQKKSEYCANLGTDSDDPLPLGAGELGTMVRVLNTDINDATIRLLTRHGCEVVVAKGAGCCGARRRS
mgnify:CR=1 FL=1